MVEKKMYGIYINIYINNNNSRTIVFPPYFFVRSFIQESRCTRRPTPHFEWIVFFFLFFVLGLWGGGLILGLINIL